MELTMEEVFALAKEHGRGLPFPVAFDQNYGSVYLVGEGKRFVFDEVVEYDEEGDAYYILACVEEKHTASGWQEEDYFDFLLEEEKVSSVLRLCFAELLEDYFPELVVEVA